MMDHLIFVVVFVMNILKKIHVLLLYIKKMRD